MANKRNILVTSAGRRVELLRAFSREAKSRGLDSNVFATDLRPETSAACHAADRSFAMPRVSAPSYCDELMKLCEAQNIGLVIPTIDTELLVLSASRAQFAAAGVHIVISDLELVRACRDKRLTDLLFGSIGIDRPKLLDRNRLSFPCFVKPYDGSRGVGAFKLNGPSDLTVAMLNDEKLMFLEYIDSSFAEYTVDAYFDRNGALKCLVPRHRLEVRDGEVSKGVTRKADLYHYLLERIPRISGARGCLTVQLFACPKGRRYAAIEINPRFGGGFPLSYSAGANYPGWLIDEYLFGLELHFFDAWKTDLLMLRYDAQVLVDNAI